MPANIKELLHQHCIAYVQKRIQEAENAFRDAEQAANDDTKSSAGDKYETGREMMQQEKNRITAQLNEANKLMVALNRTGTKGSPVVDNGSLVITDKAKFYLAISAGNITINGEIYIAVSPASPIGFKLKGLKAGDGFELNGKQYQVKQVL
ncbi:MAG: 3-oxoacyl-ACP synthase [Mucilaginibacter sp.]